MNRRIVEALAIAGGMLGVAPLLQLVGEPGDEVRLRAIHVVLGLSVVWSANWATKRIAPLSATSCSPAREQRLRRTSGMLIFAGGAAYSLVWLAAPLPLAFPLALSALAGAVLVTFAQYGLLFRHKRT